ncbi:Glutathione S-transferase [Melia azedarach]|uniref:Glutathione S-transferase n=1 Tax=Melia azedarach TaxID=155640 RepID=A0ACC1WQW6_MELAZ|nr:Glutathione S-transferase [Melia azedarach]
MGEESLKLLGYWASPFALRVTFHKKVPVLVHDGKPLAKSLLIIEYIDEVWNQNPLLPQHPYEKTDARFWATFFDEKCVSEVFGAFASKGEEEQEERAAKARENLKMLEKGLQGKPFFGVKL